jgi:hypothetical protein
MKPNRLLYVLALCAFVILCGCARGPKYEIGDFVMRPKSKGTILYKIVGVSADKYTTFSYSYQGADIIEFQYYGSIDVAKVDSTYQKVAPVKPTIIHTKGELNDFWESQR